MQNEVNSWVLSVSKIAATAKHLQSWMLHCYICMYIFFCFLHLHYITSYWSTEKYWKAWKSFFSVMVVNVLNKNQVLIPSQRLEKLQLIGEKSYGPLLWIV